MINIAELLKNCPKGTKLYSPLFGEVKFVRVDKRSGYPIEVIDCNGNGKSFTEFGVYFANHPHAECLLFPSEKVRTWEGWKVPVESKFKVGDWVVRKDGDTFSSDNYAEQITSIEVDEKGKFIWLSSKTWVRDDDIRLWTIQDAKAGDVLLDEDTGTIGIFEKIYGTHWYSKIYCGNSTCAIIYANGGAHEMRTKPATKEQRDLLFAMIKKIGYEWDEEKKELRKIQPHYDIANFQPFDKVLVRCGNDEEWTIEFYCKYDTLVHTSPHRDYPFMGIGDSYSQCIPYEGNEHLLGTTDMPSEEYINW